MAKAYAGVLGSLGMSVMLWRGVLADAGFEGTVRMAVVAMLAMALVGALVGWIAEATVDESVRNRLQKQIEEHEARDA